MRIRISRPRPPPGADRVTARMAAIDLQCANKRTEKLHKKPKLAANEPATDECAANESIDDSFNDFTSNTLPPTNLVPTNNTPNDEPPNTPTIFETTRDLGTMESRDLT